MTEENNPYKNKTLDVTVTVDRSPELMEKDRIISELTEQLTQIASRELDSRCDKFGISKDFSDEVKIAKIKEAELSRSNTALLNDQQTRDYNSKDSGEYDTIEQGIIDLNKQAESNPELKKELGRVAKKALKPTNGTVFDYTLEPTFNPKTGKLGCLQNFRKPIMDKISKDTFESEQSLSQRKTAKKLEQKWSKRD